jgi:hypothetical protein
VGGLRGVAVAGVVEVGRGVVEAEGHIFGLGGFDELGHDVFLIGRVGDFVIGVGGVEHAEAVVVFGGEDDVALAGGFGEADEGAGVELFRVEADGQGTVFGFGDAGVLLAHDGPGGFDAGERIGAPMDEHAELGVVEAMLALGLVGVGGEAGGNEQDEGDGDSQHRITLYGLNG